MKKSNLYSSVDYNSLQKEVKSILQYLDQLDIENISDDLEWKITAKGGVAPAIISTIEKKILTSLKVIQQCSRIALAMNDKEGLTPFLEGMIFTVVNTLKNIQGYYNNRPIALIEHRKLTKESGKDKKGNTKSITFLCASREDQIQARSRITELVLEILPLIEKLETVQSTSSLRGGKEIEESLMYDN